HPSTRFFLTDPATTLIYTLSLHDALPIFKYLQSKLGGCCPMTNHKNGNRYNDDFRKMVVDLYHSGLAVRDLSSEYGVSEVTIYAWIKKLTPMELEDGSSATPDDYAALQKQMLKLQQQNDILKKAMAIFAKKSTTLKSLHSLIDKKMNARFILSVMFLVCQEVRIINH